MPKTKLQDIYFTIVMVFFMVYAMICYNISLATGGLHMSTFAAAFRELRIMGPAAFILEFFIIGGLVKKLAFTRVVDVKTAHPYNITLAISGLTVAFMCPLMSLIATVLFKHAGGQFIAVWLQTTALNFPMAFAWQIFYAGPAVRFIFRQSMKLWSLLSETVSVHDDSEDEDHEAA